MKTKYLIGLIAIPFLMLAMCSSNPTDPTDLVSFSGRITLDNNAFSGVDVYLSGDSSRKVVTSSTGEFSFGNLPGGSYIITPAKSGYAFNPSRFSVGSSSQDNLDSTASTATYGTEVDSIAQDFTALDQNGDPVTLSDYHGKVILLDFTADWCVECREKALTAEAYYQAHKDAGLMYILVVIEGSAEIWATTYGLTFPVLDDNAQVIYDQYKKTTLPLPHVIDRNMTIRYKKEGWNKSEVENLIGRLL